MIERLFELSHYYLRKHNKPFKRDFLGNPLQNRISIVTGQRGVGKTTALIQHLLNLCNHDPFTRKGLYVPVDNTLVARYTPCEIAGKAYKEGVKIIFFDDIHKFPQWHRDVKHIYHHYPDLKLFISGCAAMDTHETSQEIKRRSAAYRMKGFSFREFIAVTVDPRIQLKHYTLDEIVHHHASILNDIVSTLEQKEKDILPLFRDYLRFGYYPGFIDHDNDREALYLEFEENVRKTVTNDSTDVYPHWNGAGIKKTLKLLGLLTEAVPCVPDLEDLKQKLEIENIHTLGEYLNFLAAAGVIRRIPRQKEGGGGDEEPGRLYLDNTNLVYALEDSDRLNSENIRDTFFAGTVSSYYNVQTTGEGSFTVDDRFTFNVRGDIDNAYLETADTETGIDTKIPLPLFGFLH